jgi:outer membrane immunogenic protein
MTFKATVFGALASIVAMGAAAAADLPSYKAPPPPPAPAPFSWSGYHFGISGGYGGGSANYISSVYSFAPAFAWNHAESSHGTSGFLVGAQSGALWQMPNNIVLGYESDFSYADVSSNNNGGWGGAGLRSRLRWFGTERARIGYAFGRFLPYVTGGLAYGQLFTGGVENVGGFLFPTSASKWQAGWTVGGGLEYAALDNISVKAEYLYSSLQGTNGNGLAFPAAYRTFQGNGFDTHMARVGVNYQFKSIGALLGIANLGL